MSPEAARELLKIWDWFEKHPELLSYENVRRSVFLRDILIITEPWTGTTDDLKAAREALTSIAAGEISGDMPAEIIEKVKSGEISQAEVSNIQKTTELTRAWISKLKAKTPDEIAERQVAAAQVQAVIERVEEEKQATTAAVPKPKAEAPKAKVAVITKEAPAAVATIEAAPPPTPTPETPGFAFKIISPGSLPAAGRAAVSPLRSMISFAFPSVSVESTTDAAALTYIATYGVSAKSLTPLKPKALTLGISPEQFDKFIASVSKYEVSLPQLIYQGRTLDISPYQVEALFFTPGGDGVSAVVPNGGFFSNILRGAGQQLFGKVSSDFIKGLLTKGAEKAATTAAAAGAEAVGAGAAAATGPAGWVAAAVFLGKELLSKFAVWVNKHRDWAFAAAFAPVALAGLIFAIPALTAIGALGIGASFLGGPGAAVTSIGGFLGTAISALGSIVVASIATPVIVALIGIPVLVAIILFIINSGAYLVPPSELALKSENPYISIDKAPDPAGPFQNSALPLKITYKITITPKKGTLTNLSIKNTCKIIREGSQPDCPAAEIPVPTEISPASPFSFSYQETYSGDVYKDSLVIDTVEVTADTAEEKGTSTGTSASLSIGNPPTKCLAVEGSWPSGYRANIESARGTLISSYGSYVAKVCSSYDKISLRFVPGGRGSYWGFNSRSYIEFYPHGVDNKPDALYTLAHELGHSLVWGAKTASIWMQYLGFEGITSEVPQCFYQYGGDIGERLQEAIAFYVIQPRCGSVQAKYPAHFRFLKRFVFN